MKPQFQDLKMASTYIIIQFIMATGRQRHVLDLHYLTIIDAEHEFYSNAMGGSWAIARCLLPFRLFRDDGNTDTAW